MSEFPRVFRINNEADEHTSVEAAWQMLDVSLGEAIHEILRQHDVTEEVSPEVLDAVGHQVATLALRGGLEVLEVFDAA